MNRVRLKDKYLKYQKAVIKPIESLKECTLYKCRVVQGSVTCDDGTVVIKGGHIKMPRFFLERLKSASEVSRYV